MKTGGKIGRTGRGFLTRKRRRVPMRESRADLREIHPSKSVKTGLFSRFPDVSMHGTFDAKKLVSVVDTNADREFT